jgi:SAM-dependent methyltransferase
MRQFAGTNSNILHYRRGGPRLLDLGCGDGARAIALAGRNFNRVTGLDEAESLIEIAARRAAKRNVDAFFVCGDPRATPFKTGAFDEVMLLGELFGHHTAARADIELLREARRVLKAGGRLHLGFADGDWTRRHLPAQHVEKLPGGFVYHQRSLSADGRSLHTKVLTSGDEYGIAYQAAMTQWLYTPRDVTELLHRIGFDSITYDDALADCHPGRFAAGAPRFVVHCKASHSNVPLRLAPGFSEG